MVCRHGRRTRWISPYLPVYVSVLLAAAIWLAAMPQILRRFSIRAAGSLSARDAVPLDWVPARSTAPSPKPRYEGAAIVTLAGGDEAARGLIALLQSLRDVGTTLPVVILLARGALGSAACRNPEWKKRVGRPDVDCRGPDTIGERSLSDEAVLSASPCAVGVHCGGYPPYRSRRDRVTRVRRHIQAPRGGGSRHPVHAPHAVY